MTTVEKWHLLSFPGESPTVPGATVRISTHSMAEGLPERHNSLRHWMEQCFSHIEKRQSKISFSHVYWPPWPADLVLRLMQGDGLQASLSYCKRRTWFPPRQEEIQYWPGAIWHTDLIRTKEHTFSLKQEKIFPHNVISPAQAVGLSLGEEVFQGQSPFLHDHGGVERLHAHEWLCQWLSSRKLKQVFGVIPSTSPSIPLCPSSTM